MLKQIKLFQNSIRSPQTKRTYMILLQKYVDYVGKDKDLFFGDNSKLIQDCIIDFIIMMKDQNKTYSAIHNYVTPIISFYKINDIVLNTKKINKFLPEYVKVKKDRPYTHEEISKLLEIADEKMRVVILLLASTGMRIGAIPSLMLRNLEEIEDMYKVTVYENTIEEYITFTTPECRKVIDSYLDMRKSYGEKINGDSYLIREYFNSRDPNRIRNPHKLTVYTLEWKLMELAKRCLIRKIEHQTEGKYIASMRKDVAIAHGFRKFTNTEMIKSGLNLVAKEMLLGHDIGLDEHYYRPSEVDLLNEYQKAIDNLTIDPTQRLRKKIETLQVEKSRLEKMEQDIKDIKQGMNKQLLKPFYMLDDDEKYKKIDNLSTNLLENIEDIGENIPRDTVPDPISASRTSLHHPDEEYPPDCYYCDQVFDGIGKQGYEKHVLNEHKGKPCYPGIADIKFYS